MLKTILRKEHKNKWEKRSALTPAAISSLIKDGYNIDVEHSDIRIFDDASYADKNAKLFDSPDHHQLVIGIKEPPVDSIREQQVHLCFSHTIKGQDYNMPLLQHFIDQKATLLDYELMTDSEGKRIIAFGQQAGIAGAVDSLWIAGQKQKLKGITSPLSAILQTICYQTIEKLTEALSVIDMQADTPVRILIIGSGNVGQGAEMVCQWLGLPKLDAASFLLNDLPKGSWYCVVSSSHIHQRLAGGDFDYNEYIEQGKNAYKSILDSLLGRFDVLLQTSFWTEFYPRHLDEQQLIQFHDKLPLVLGDISCDIDGSFACTKKVSTIDQPAFTYDARTATIKDGICGTGITVMSIDNLPCELSLDASVYFSEKLQVHIPDLMNMDLSLSFKDVQLPEELKKAVIVYRGELCENFNYLNEFL